MRRLGYTLGIVLLLLGGASIVAQLLFLWATGTFEPVTMGSIWYAIHANSLVGFQGLIERTISPALWTPIQFVLTLPAWITLPLPGLILLLGCRPRPRGLGTL